MIKLIYFISLILLSTTSLFAQEYERYKKLVDTTISSDYLGYDKSITITVPFEWQKDLDTDFPLIIVFDRQNPRSHNYILNTIDYLTSNDQMPSSIVISVSSEDQYRYKETLHKVTSEKGLALENEQFIFDELIPLAENEYHASSFRLLVGHSRYGYLTSALFCSRPEDINGVISMSPFFEQENVSLTDSIIKLEEQKFDTKKYYRYGIGNDYPKDFSKMDSTLKMLDNNSVDTKGTFFQDASHNVTPGLMISSSLYEIFEFWANRQSSYFSENQKDLEITSSLEKAINDHYGSSLKFSLGVLNGKGWFFYNQGEFEKAIEAWELLMSTYPNFSMGYLFILDAQKQLDLDVSATVENFKSSLASSEFYSEAEKNELLKELENMNE